MFDTASAIRRLQDNASDKFLEVVQPTDIPALLHRIPQCKAIVTTGEKVVLTSPKSGNKACRLPLMEQPAGFS